MHHADQCVAGLTPTQLVSSLLLMTVRTSSSTAVPQLNSSATKQASLLLRVAALWSAALTYRVQN